MREEKIVLLLRESSEPGANADSPPDLRGEKGTINDVLRHGEAIRIVINVLLGVADLQIYSGTWMSLEMRDKCTSAKTTNLVGRDAEKAEWSMTHS